MIGIALGVVAFLLVAGAMALWAQRIKRVQIPTDRRGFVACWVGGAVLEANSLITCAKASVRVPLSSFRILAAFLKPEYA